LEWPRLQLDDETADAIRSIAPILAATEQQAASERRLPQAAVDAMREAGLFRITLPAEVGGREVEPLVEMEVYEQVAWHSTAACWNLSVGNLHTALPAAYASDEAVEELFGEGRQPIVAGQPVPLSTGRPESGGMRVSGRHSWGSGMAHAEWVIAACTVEGEPTADGGPAVRAFVVSKEQVEVVDDWHVAGLEGSGSPAFVLDDVLVPEGFWWDHKSLVRRRGGPRFTTSMSTQAAASHLGVALGAGQRALALVASLATRKTRLGASGPVAERGAFQRDLGKAYAELAAARESAAALLRELARLQRAGGTLPGGFSERLRAATTHATDVAVSAAGFAFRSAGGSAVRLESPIQRTLRDLLVAQQHAYVDDVSYGALGARLLAEEAGSEPSGGGLARGERAVEAPVPTRA
jgi:indole-3-acetate monooxygenase